MSMPLSSMRKMLRCLHTIDFFLGLHLLAVPQSLCSDFSFFKQAWIYRGTNVRVWFTSCRVPVSCVLTMIVSSLKGKFIISFLFLLNFRIGFFATYQIDKNGELLGSN